MGWIDNRMRQAYTRLHHMGWAHSLEVWDADGLAGGLYGVSIGGLFAGESMFHRRRDASKVALVHLVDVLTDQPSDGRPPRRAVGDPAPRQPRGDRSRTALVLRRAGDRGEARPAGWLRPGRWRLR